MKEITIIRDVMARNKFQAQANREIFQRNHNFTINLMGSPGSGKTTFIEGIIKAFGDRCRFGVIEGDYEGTNDTERLQTLAIPVVQINSKTCHLTADFVHEAMIRLPLEKLDVVFIENIGNLICPATHDLGEDLKLVILSAPEGADKLDKYPLLFSLADLVVITKTDLLPYVDFSMDKVTRDLKAINAHPRILPFSTKDPSCPEPVFAAIDSFRRLAGKIS
jgi:hydrogenase nickel incorporation protein HypB